MSEQSPLAKAPLQIGEPPKDRVFYARHHVAIKWTPYKPTSQEVKRGKLGRWQELRPYGIGWQNTDVKPEAGAWVEDVLNHPELLPANPNTPVEMLEVTQADRDAFAALEEAFPPHMGGEVFRDGVADEHLGVQAFARHRLAHAKEQAAGVDTKAERLVSALQEIKALTSAIAEYRRRVGDWSANDHDHLLIGALDSVARKCSHHLAGEPAALAAPASSVPDSTPLPALVEALEVDLLAALRALKTCVSPTWHLVLDQALSTLSKQGRGE